MDVSYQLSPVNSPPPWKFSIAFPGYWTYTLLGMSLDLTNASIHCAMCPGGERNKGLSLTFQPPEESRGVQRPKRCDKHGDKDEDNSPKNVNENLCSYEKVIFGTSDKNKRFIHRSDYSAFSIF